jgi:simple sugar transport system permease protein
MAEIRNPSLGASRIRSTPLYRRLAGRPALGAVVGFLVVWVFFSLVANSFFTYGAAATYLNVAAEVGVVASMVTLLLIGGEFDLSVGAMVGWSGMFCAISIVAWNWPLWLALLGTFGLAALYGVAVGLLVVRTGLPSFMVTLGGLFFLRGLTLGFSRGIVGRAYVEGVIAKVGGDPLMAILSGQFLPGLNITVIWWLLLSALAAYVLGRTRFGNWILAVGGSGPSARALGVPVDRVKIILFVGTAMAAALLGVISALTYGSADPLRGQQKEFEAAIIAIVGGTLLSGGYGSAIGTVFGALTLGVVRQGLFFLGIEADWYQMLLGIVLFAAVLLNQLARSRAVELHRAPTKPGPDETQVEALLDGLSAPPGPDSEGLLADRPILEARDVSKYFGGVIALETVSLKVYSGEVVCLLGDNGAGKSTLIKILSGVFPPDGGTLHLEGEGIRPRSPRDMLQLGVATVYQDLAVFPLMSIARNFVVGAEPTKGWGPFRRLDLREASRVAHRQLERIGIEVRSTDQIVGTLSGGERQTLAIARAEHRGARVLILDEPTSALGVNEAAIVLHHVLGARARGLGVVLITHNVEHALPVGDSFVILSRGRLAGVYEASEVDDTRLVRLMGGGKALENLKHDLALQRASKPGRARGSKGEASVSASARDRFG